MTSTIPSLSGVREGLLLLSGDLSTMSDKLSNLLLDLDTVMATQGVATGGGDSEAAEHGEENAGAPDKDDGNEGHGEANGGDEPEEADMAAEEVDEAPLTEEADVLPEVVSADEDLEVEVEVEVEAEVEAVDKEKETGERQAKQLPKALPPLSQTQVSMLKARAAGYAQVGPLMGPPQQQKPKPTTMHMATATKTLQKAQPREMTTEKAQINFVSRNLSKGWGLGKI